MAGFHSKTFLKHDDYMTPLSAWDSIKEYIPKDKLIWEAFYGDGQSGKHLEQLGFNVIHEEIDFFDNDKGDIIISNPPFSDKIKILKRLKELDKPFIIILPQPAINIAGIRELFKEDLQLIIPRRRIQFKKNGTITENKCNFDCFYYCFKMDLKRDIIWLE